MGVQPVNRLANGCYELLLLSEIAGLLYHGTIPDLGRRFGKPRMAEGKLIEAVTGTRMNRG